MLRVHISERNENRFSSVNFCLEVDAIDNLLDFLGKAGELPGSGHCQRSCAVAAGRCATAAPSVSVRRGLQADICQCAAQLPHSALFSHVSSGEDLLPSNKECQQEQIQQGGCSRTTAVKRKEVLALCCAVKDRHRLFQAVGRPYRPYRIDIICFTFSVCWFQSGGSTHKMLS